MYIFLSKVIPHLQIVIRWLNKYLTILISTLLPFDANKPPPPTLFIFYSRVIQKVR